MYGHPSLVPVQAAIMKPRTDGKAVEALKSFAQKTAWGVTLGVTEVPEPEFIYVDSVIANALVYGWKIDKHGIFVIENTAAACKAAFVKAYREETQSDTLQSDLFLN